MDKISIISLFYSWSFDKLLLIYTKNLLIKFSVKMCVFSCFYSIEAWTNGCHFVNVFKCILLKEIFIYIQISQKFSNGPVDNKLAFGLGNGLVLNMGQAITRAANDPLFTAASMGHQVSMSCSYVRKWHLIC